MSVVEPNGLAGGNEHRMERVWGRIMSAALSLPGAKVDRTQFLRTQLRSYCNEDEVQLAVEQGPARASIPLEVVDGLADACIWGHYSKAAAVSFAVGIPGGLALPATIPADLVQYYWHVVQLAQKLAYLYGWPDLLENGEVDERTEQHITILIGAMMGAVAAGKALTEVTERFAQQVATRLPQYALTHFPVYNLSRVVARWIGVKMTKGVFARGISKMIPVAGGLVSASITGITMRAGARRLKNHLRGLQFNYPVQED